MLLTRLPLGDSIAKTSPFDLHALGTPPAFILSQDQTLRLIFLSVFFSQSGHAAVLAA